MKNMIELEEDIILRVKDKKIILEKGDKIKVLEGATSEAREISEKGRNIMRIIRRDGRLTEADGYSTFSKEELEDLEKLIANIDFKPLIKEFKDLGFDVRDISGQRVEKHRDGLALYIASLKTSQVNLGVFKPFMTYVSIGMDNQKNKISLLQSDDVIWEQGWYLDCLTKQQQPVESLRDIFMTSILNLTSNEWEFERNI